MAGIYQTPVPYLTVKHTEYLFPSFSTDPYSLTLKEVAKVFSSESVALSFPRNTQYQGLAFTIKPTATEIVTVDKWNHDTDRPTPDLKRQQYTYPFTFFYPQDLEVTRFENPGEFSRNVDRIYDRARTQYLYPAYSANILPIEETADLQDAGIYQTNLPLFSTKHTEYLYPVSVIDLKQLTQKERITPDKWQAKTNEPLFDVKKNQSLYPPFSIDPSQLTRSETAKVFSQESVLLSYPRNTQYQSLTFLNRGTTSQEASTLDKWFKETQRPVWDVRRQQYLYPSFFFHPVPFPNPEILTVDKWHPLIVQPLFDQKRQQFSYPYFFIDPKHLTDSERITLEKWYRLTEQPFFIPHNHGYISYFFEPRHRLPTDYHDKYKTQTTTFNDKYSSRGSSYNDKYSGRNTAYDDKYSSRGSGYSDKYSTRNTPYNDKYPHS